MVIPLRLSHVKAVAAICSGLAGFTVRVGSLSWFVSPLREAGVMFTSSTWACRGPGITASRAKVSSKAEPSLGGDVPIFRPPDIGSSRGERFLALDGQADTQPTSGVAHPFRIQLST